MGQDLVQKRNEQFVRCVEIHYEKGLSDRDLFSSIPPDERVELAGFQEEGVDLCPGVELWHPMEGSGNGSGSDVNLFIGDQAAVVLRGEAAEAVRALEEEDRVRLNFRVTDVDSSSGLTTVTPIQPNRQKS